MRHGELIPPTANLTSSLLNMTNIHVAVMLVRWYAKGNLMDLCANQLWSTGAGTKHLVGVTSVFMALLSVTSMVSMKVSSHRHSPIQHFPLALILIWHSKPPWRALSSLSNDFHPTTGDHFQSIPHLCRAPSLLFAGPEPWFASCPLPCCNSSTMPRERGKPKRGLDLLQLHSSAQSPRPLATL
jgi:hypothetical protein